MPSRRRPSSAAAFRPATPHLSVLALVMVFALSVLGLASIAAHAEFRLRTPSMEVDVQPAAPSSRLER